MTEEQINLLKIGDRVVWDNDTMAMGTIYGIQKHASTVLKGLSTVLLVNWDDGHSNRIHAEEEKLTRFGSALI